MKKKDRKLFSKTLFRLIGISIFWLIGRIFLESMVSNHNREHGSIGGKMVISILTVWECDENTFQSSKSIFLGTRGYSLKFERSENFKEAPSCPEKCFYKTEK